MKVRAVFLRDILERLSDLRTREVYFDTLALRQRTFTTVDRRLLMIDEWDLISTHCAVYGDDGTILATIRATRREDALAYGKLLPTDYTLQTATQRHRNAWHDFIEAHPATVHASIVCVAPEAKWLFRRFRIDVSRLIFNMFGSLVLESGQSSYCAVIRTEARIERWLEPMGVWERLPPIAHPKVAGDHQLILVPQIDAQYIEEVREEFRDAYADQDQPRG